MWNLVLQCFESRYPFHLVLFHSPYLVRIRPTLLVGPIDLVTRVNRMAAFIVPPLSPSSSSYYLSASLLFSNCSILRGGIFYFPLFSIQTLFLFDTGRIPVRYKGSDMYENAGIEYASCQHCRGWEGYGLSLRSHLSSPCFERRHNRWHRWATQSNQNTCMMRTTINVIALVCSLC